MANEAVNKNRESEYSFIRHVLALLIGILTRNNIRQSLIDKFCSFNIDLNIYYHKKEFYLCIIQMLMAVKKHI